VRLRVIAPVVLVLAATAGGFALTRIEADREAKLVLAVGLALAAVTGALAVTTERRRRAMREVERYFALSPEMVILAGFDGYWKRVNPAVEKVLGYSESEALTRPFMELVHPDDLARTEQEARRVIGGATALAFENRLLCKDGSYKWIEWTVTPVPEEQVMYGLGRDVTDRRRSEAEQAALQRIATLAAEAAQAENLFAAVAEEVARVFDVPRVSVVRYDTDETAAVYATFPADGQVFPAQSRRLESTSVHQLVKANRGVAQIDDDSGSTMGAPIVVAGHIWGAMVVSSEDGPLPAHSESRLASFTELLATAISNAQARDDLRPLVDQQAALRRVATLVAEGVTGDELFAAVAREVAIVLGASMVTIDRYDPDGFSTVLASLDDPGFPVGSRWPLDGPSLGSAVLETGRPARIDDYAHLESTSAAAMRRWLVNSAVGAPILVDGLAWGVICAARTGTIRLPAEAEAQLGDFTELVAAAIARAASRQRIARVAEEQAALRRVAVRVAEGASATSVFTSVAEEVASVLGVQTVILGRYGPGPVCTVVSEANDPVFPVGSAWPLDGPSVARTIFDEGRPARIEDYSGLPGTIATALGSAGIRSTVGAPIVVDGGVWGCISVLATGPESLPTDAEERLEQFTDLVATAISNIESHDALARLVEQQAALRRVATLVAEGAGPTELFNAVAVEVGRLFDFAAVTLNRYEEDAVVVLADPLDSGFPAGSRWPFDGDSLAVRVHETRRMARIDDYSEVESSAGARMRERDSRSAMGVPIFVEGDLWGLLCVGAAASELLPPDTADRIAGFVELVGTAIANGQARDRLRLLAEEQAALGHVATLVAQGAQTDEIFLAVTREVGRLFAAQAAVGRVEPDGRALYFVRPDGGRERVEFGDLLASAEVFRTGRSIRADASQWESAEGETAERLRSLGIVSIVSSPIVVEGDVRGIINVGGTDAVLPPDTEERLEKFTEIVATAIASAESREARAALTEEQAALRRVATLVARDVPSAEVFDAVATEVGALLDTDITVVGRYDGDGVATAIGSWSASPGGVPVGTRSALGGHNVLTMVSETGRPARIDGYDDASGEAADIARRYGWRSSIAAPIAVEGRLWGVMLVATQRPDPFPAGAEERLAKFTDLVATAVGNAQGKSELAASRRRIVAASDETRRRIERDLHDGTQQRLVSLGLALRAAEASVPPEREDLRAELSNVAAGLIAAVEDLQEISRGIHPAILSKGGLGPALRALAHRSAVPVHLDITDDVRLAEPIEAAAYFVASEALANAAKHSHATRIDVSLQRHDRRLLLSISDDGVGGADAGRGSGLTGLSDRVEALGGSIRVFSRSGEGTRIEVELPIQTAR
jgi:PAS domain S-box-containing protein